MINFSLFVVSSVIVFRSVANFCSTYPTVSSKSHSGASCMLLACLMFKYLAPVAPIYRLNFFVGTGIVFPESEDMISVSATSSISDSVLSSSVCVCLGLLVLGPASFVLGRFLTFSFTLRNFFCSVSSAVPRYTVFSFFFHNTLFYSIAQLIFILVQLSGFVEGSPSICLLASVYLLKDLRARYFRSI